MKLSDEEKNKAQSLREHIIRTMTEANELLLYTCILFNIIREIALRFNSLPIGQQYLLGFFHNSPMTSRRDYLIDILWWIFLKNVIISNAYGLRSRLNMSYKITF